MRRRSMGASFLRFISRVSICAATLTHTTAASAQTPIQWTGPYGGVTVGAALQRDDGSEIVAFDTNLDGTFDDTVRTATGANAFSPGFCAGIAVGPTPGAGCSEDEAGIDIGGRLGYDWQAGRAVVGGLIDITGADVADGVTAFSTTPAFYSFSRELTYMMGLRARAGIGTPRVLVYGTGGGAWARIDHVFTSNNGVNTFRPGRGERLTAGSWGYQLGGGVTWRVAERWSLTGEYLFTSLDDRDDSVVRSQGPAPATNPFILVNTAGTDLRRSDRFELQSMRVGLDYRF